MNRQTIVRRCGLPLRRPGRRTATAAAGSLAAAVLAATPAATRAQSLVVDNASGNGSYTPPASATYSGISVGDTSTGVLTQPSFNLTSTGLVIVGNTSTGVGTYTLSGTAGLVANSSGGGLFVGQNGNGTFGEFNSSSVVLGTNALFVGNASGGAGSYTIGDSATLACGAVIIGEGGGSGTFTQTGGTVTQAAGYTTYVAYSGTSALNLSGGAYTASLTNVGTYGNGVINETGGTYNAGQSYISYFGQNTGGQGTLNLSGGTFLASQTDVGNLGVGTFNQNGSSTLTSFYNANQGLGIYLGNASGGSGTWNLTGNATAKAGGVIVGYSGTGVVNEFNTSSLTTLNTSSSGYSLFIGYNAGATGTYNLGDTASLTSGALYVGYAGTGTFNQTGGTIGNAGYSMYLGRSGTASKGTYTLTNGAANVYVLYNGYNGSGGVSVGGGGTLSTASFVDNGYGTGSVGTISVTGGLLTTAASFYNGYNGSGGLTVAGGAVSTTTFYNGYNANYSSGTTGNGTVTMTGGTLATTGSLINGYYGNGRLTLTGGTINVGTNLYEGYGTPGVGTVTVSGTGTLNVSSSVYVNYNGGGSSFNVAAGGVVNVAGTFNGQDNTGVGTVNVTGGTLNTGLFTSGTFQTAAANTGVVNLMGGAINASGGAIIGYTDTGIVNQTGGTFSTLNATTSTIFSLTLGNNSTGIGTYNLSGGTLYAYQILGGLGSGTLNLNGGSLQSSATTTTFVSGLTAANVLGGGAVFNVTSGVTATAPQALLHAATLGATADGGLTKLGTGALYLTGANTYIGPTNVTAGTLRVNTPAGTTPGAYTVSAGALLGGSGNTGSGAVTINSGGFIGAGFNGSTAVGTLTTGPQTWSGNANTGGYLVKTDGNTADRLLMSGLTILPTATAATPFFVTPSSNSSSAVTLADGTPATTGAGLLIATDSDTTSTQAMSIGNPFAAAITTGALVVGPAASTTVLPAAGDGLSLYTTQDTGGYELYLVSTAAPEPTSLILAALAAGPLALGRRRRRRAVTAAA